MIIFIRCVVIKITVYLPFFIVVRPRLEQNYFFFDGGATIESDFLFDDIEFVRGDEEGIILS